MIAQRWLEEHFGCRLQQDALLRQALSHRSVGRENNERLEFLGDAVLGYVISETLYERFPEADEGQLSRLRVSLVKGSSLARLAQEIGLTEQLLLGTGQDHSGVRQRSSVLADTLEALLGAIVLDQGIETCRAAIFRVFSGRLESLALDQAKKDPKTRLQEFLQGSGPQSQLSRGLRARGRYAAGGSRRTQSPRGGAGGGGLGTGTPRSKLTPLNPMEKTTS